MPEDSYRKPRRSTRSTLGSSCYQCGTPFEYAINITINDRNQFLCSIDCAILHDERQHFDAWWALPMPRPPAPLLGYPLTLLEVAHIGDHATYWNNWRTEHAALP